jgi:hypothetical protein
MSYIYYPSQKASKHYELILHHPTNMNFTLICYHVNMEGRYPFIQLLLEKSEFQNSFKLPQINILSDALIEETTTNKVLSMLKTFITKKIEPEDIIIDGIINGTPPIMLVNLTNINIFNLEFTQTSNVWFVLFNEIVNNENIYNIPIDDNSVSFCVSNPIFGSLYYTTPHGNKKEYPVPDVAYTGSNYKESKIYNTLGLVKTKGKYDYQFYFVTNMNDAAINSIESINRYAVFVDKSVSFTKEEIDKYVNKLNKSIDDALMKYDSVYIQDEPSLLILKEYNQHVPLTYYILQ